ncbi:MAG: septum formation initiator family protein [Candidatus Margulisbacteria bacterium]|nr:septum formation initiator family protein [Candidatus Margulisiibacteriota bacterium]MBU1616365.1 septum formation initiator family protein [Candidatus Margulisiibacteriota bacterium]MBU1867105.1 septum formation initiator family protein [Candidatus Margulisiibacteriota bacterium]
MKFRQILAVIMFFLLLSGIHLFFNAINIRLKYQLTDLRIKWQELISRNRELGTRIAIIENLDSIDQIAKSRLGMYYPDEVIYVVPTKEADVIY